MFINARLERRLSIAATALLTAAIFVMPAKTRAYIGISNTASYVADATPVAKFDIKRSVARPH